MMHPEKRRENRMVIENGLKPCPFCGGEAKFKSSLDVTPLIDENGAYVDYDEVIYSESTGCENCGIWFFNNPFDDNEPEGITRDKWNRRAEVNHD